LHAGDGLLMAWHHKPCAPWQADAAQATLSACKVWIALLPDGCRLQLIAPRSNTEDPAALLGVHPVLPFRPMEAPAKASRSAGTHSELGATT
jgi:hypothetical protein